jgi:hypothetical protein
MDGRNVGIVRNKRKQKMTGRRLSLEEYIESLDNLGIEQLKRENAILKDKIKRIEEIIKE